MKILFDKRRREEGSLIIYAFLAVIILGAIGGVATYVTHNVETTQRRVSYGEAYNFSEAGVMLASAHVNYAFTNSGSTFVENLADGNASYGKDTERSDSQTLVYTNTITYPFTNQPVRIELTMENASEPSNVRIASVAHVRGVTVTNTAVVELTFAYRATIVSDHYGSASANVTMASALLGNVVIPTAAVASPLLVDGRIIANGRVNLGSIGMDTNMIAMTNYGTAKQVPDYTASGSADQLFDFDRLIKAADLTDNHYTSIDAFIRAARKEEVFEGIIVVDARKEEEAEDEEEDKDDDDDDDKDDDDDDDKDDDDDDDKDDDDDSDKDNKGHGNNVDGVDVDNPGKSKADDPSGDVDDEKKCGEDFEEDEFVCADADDDDDDDKDDDDDDDDDKDDDDDDDDGPGIDPTDVPSGIYVRGTLIFNWVFDDDDDDDKDDDDDDDKDDDDDDDKDDDDDDDDDSDKDNKGHGNNEDGVDVDNPGKSKADDPSGDVDDEKCGADFEEDEFVCADGDDDDDDDKDDDDDDDKDDDDDDDKDDDDGDDGGGVKLVDWDDDENLLDGVGLFINWINLDTLQSGVPSSYTTAYPPTIQDSEKDPKNLNMAAHGFPNFTADEDLPALMFNGGTMTLRGTLDVCGVVYSPNFIDIQNAADTVQYIKGTIFAGGGVYVENNASGSKTILSFDSRAVDDLATKYNRGMQVAVRHRD